MSEKSHPAHHLSSLSTMTSNRMLFNLPDADDYEFDFDANELMSLQSPISLTSSLLALSPISDLDLTFLPNSDLSTSPSDEILRATRWPKIYIILEKLSTILKQLPVHIDDFCEALCKYSDKTVTEELSIMVHEAQLRDSKRLEYYLVNITQDSYFEIIEYWLSDIDEGAIRDCVVRWADVATELGGACQIVARAVEGSSRQWALAERWLQDVGTKQKFLEENTAVHHWSIWWLDSREHLSPSTMALKIRLEPIRRCTQDLRQAIEQLGSFWEQLSSDIREVSRNKMSDSHALLISSGHGKELVKQWSAVTDLMRKLWFDRNRAANRVRKAPPGIVSTGMGHGA
ncbi:glycoside hydrolase family 115 protein [Tulasnella calospora MUT 4182]|uniref:Glycoside hydrolase family 115 protein n=1 Tax=Tulasnella calospora MUT 4182 TaxID=1051891 RepID=A0A0C3Q378_9AGAM|nr:glycoside hydrolase family 115 protein [Tulasnella calospora MUT 4182]